MKTETVKKIVTGEVALPNVHIGFVPGEKFKTQEEVEKGIEEELAECNSVINTDEDR
jgi:hypothetical protein